MDEDIREALFDPDCEVEGLDDDFVLQASGAHDTAEPEAEDAFDYDAHIADLIARSESRTGFMYLGDIDELSDQESEGQLIESDPETRMFETVMVLALLGRAQCSSRHHTNRHCRHTMTMNAVHWTTQTRTPPCR